ncbi:hypothetical protein EYR38_007065 [Pleurotus pulmonarius]|nr:hypothetical protein EYR38_007065 [Pleurotus pulmonarius]
MEFCMDNRAVDAPLIPPSLTVPESTSSLPPPVVPPQAASSEHGSSEIVMAPSPIMSPVSPPRPAIKRPRRGSKLVTTPSPVLSPVSPPRPVVKRPRWGSKLNINVIRFTTPIVARGSTLLEDNASFASVDDHLDIELPQEKPRSKLSKSALSKARNNAAIANGSLTKNTKRWEAYVKKLQALDEHVEVYENNPRRIRDVRCSSCATIIVQSEAYNISRFKQHIAKCKARESKLHVQSITSMFTLHLGPHSSTEPTPKPKPAALVKRPCSGLTDAHDDRISAYTSCTEVRYAGGQSRAALANQYFGQTFDQLSEQQKGEVDLHYRASCQWELDHDDQRVFSRKCLDIVQCKSDAELQACTECLHLLTLHGFQVSISRKDAANEKRKYIPSRYQNVVTGKMYATNLGLGKFVQETSSKKGDFLLDFTTALSSGVFDNNPSFIQLLQVMLSRENHRIQGRGLQNMRYAGDFDQFCHKIQCVRPEAYRLFASQFGGRSERSMLKIRSSKPKMTIGISDATLERAIKYLNDYGYPHNAPLACAVDDTKLHPSLRPYYDQSKKTWFLLGSTGDPLIIANPEQLAELIEQASGDLATKLRLWTLIIPLPNVPPLIMAILAISESNSAPDLATVEKKLLKLLLLDSTVPINVVSLGSDSTVVERKARRLLIQSGFATVEYAYIPHPNPGTPPLKIEVRSMVFNQDYSPLYVRDVEKLDRQDDRAAARLFSAENIKHAIECGHSGLAIFLYIFGEACDAYQSHTIDHAERVRLVLLAHFFKALWKSFLVENGYPLSRHFISQEADDISDILVNGLLALIVIHRDHLSSPFPLLPWMHGSEANEHVFGLLRSMLPEFTVVHTLQLIPKLDIRLMGACKRAINTSGLQQGGAGYAHTHFDGSGANLASLATFPTQEAFDRIAGTAWIEANAIWEVLGYFRVSTSPSLSTMPVADLDVDIDDDADKLIVGEEPDADITSDQQVLDQALHAASFASVPPSERPELPEGVQEILNECGLAAAALNMRELASFDNLPDQDPNSLAEIQAALKPILATISALGPAGQAAIDELLKQALAQPTVPPIAEEAEEPTSSLSRISQYDLTVLIDERRAHQSKETTDACRPFKRSSHTVNDEPEAEEIAQSPRQLLARKIHETLKVSGINIKGETSGLARQFRWTKQASGMAFPEKSLTGNAANARKAAGSRANALIKSRKAIFATLPLTDSLATANINKIFQLSSGVFGIVLYEKKLMVGKGTH